MSNVIPGPPFPGVYRHYKGGHYVVHKVITDSTNNRPGRLTNGNIVVLYESLEHHDLKIRGIREFLETVHPDGSSSWGHHLAEETAECNECIPRFQLLNLG